MRIFYCEDRSSGKTGADATPVRVNSVQLYELTDWRAEELDAIMALEVGQAYSESKGIYVRREPDSDIAPDSIDSQIIGQHQQGLPL